MSVTDEPDARNRHRKKASRHKKYGVQEWSRWFKKWVHSHWYETEKARDQAFVLTEKANERLKAAGLDSPIRKVDR